MGQGTFCRILEKTNSWNRTREYSKLAKVNQSTASRNLTLLYKQGLALRRKVKKQKAFEYKFNENRNC